VVRRDRARHEACIPTAKNASHQLGSSEEQSRGGVSKYIWRAAFVSSAPWMPSGETRRAALSGVDFALLLSLNGAAEVLNRGAWGAEGRSMLSSVVLAENSNAVRTRRRRKRPVRQPYEVRIDGFQRGAFEDVRDAISCARIAKQECAAALIAVAHSPTGRLVMEIAP